jgi:hypothetical protein
MKESHMINVITFDNKKYVSLEDYIKQVNKLAKEQDIQVDSRSNVKGILKFNLEDPHANRAFKRACSATDAYLVLHCIANEIFRPARKHGYDDQSLNNNEEVIGKLEDMFYELLEKYGINLDDLE